MCESRAAYVLRSPSIVPNQQPHKRVTENPWVGDRPAHVVEKNDRWIGQNGRPNQIRLRGRTAPEWCGACRCGAVRRCSAPGTHLCRCAQRARAESPLLAHRSRESCILQLQQHYITIYTYIYINVSTSTIPVSTATTTTSNKNTPIFGCSRLARAIGM